jgi:predicted aspartyl protease
MRNTARVAWIIVTATLGSTSIATSQPPDDLRFAVNDRGGITVPVTINGTGPFPFLLDTGSSASAVSKSLAARLAIPLVAKAPLTTAAGSEMLPVGRIERIRVGAAAADGGLATVIRDAMLAPEKVVGIIGQDVLGPLNYTLDYRVHRLSWRADVSSRARHLTLIPSEGRFLVALPQDRADGRVMRFVPDTGSATLVVFSRDGVPPLDVQSFALTRLSSVTGERDVHTGIARQLQIGQVVWRDEPVVVVDRPGRTHQRVTACCRCITSPA